MSWRDRFSDVTFVEYTLTAMSHYSMIAWCSLLLKETRWKWINYLLSSPHMERCVGVAHSLNCGLLNNYFSLLFFCVCCVCVCIEALRMCVPQYQDHDNHHKQTTNGNCNNWVRLVTCGMCGMQLITIGTDTWKSSGTFPFNYFLLSKCFSTNSICTFPIQKCNIVFFHGIYNSINFYLTLNFRFDVCIFIFPA